MSREDWLAGLLEDLLDQINAWKDEDLRRCIECSEVVRSVAESGSPETLTPDQVFSLPGALDAETKYLLDSLFPSPDRLPENCKPSFRLSAYGQSHPRRRTYGIKKAPP